MTPESLKTARTEAGLTAAQLAEACGVDVRSVHRWEDGTRTITRLVETAITRALAETQAQPKAGRQRTPRAARNSRDNS